MNLEFLDISIFELPGHIFLHQIFAKNSSLSFLFYHFEFLSTCPEIISLCILQFPIFQFPSRLLSFKLILVLLAIFFRYPGALVFFRSQKYPVQGQSRLPITS